MGSAPLSHTRVSNLKSTPARARINELTKMREKSQKNFHKLRVISSCIYLVFTSPIPFIFPSCLTKSPPSVTLRLFLVPQKIRGSILVV